MPTPRIEKLGTPGVAVKLRLGVRCVMSESWLAPVCRIASPFTTVMAIGTSRRFSDRRSAVTTMSAGAFWSGVPAVVAGVGSGAVCSVVDCACA